VGPELPEKFEGADGPHRLVNDAWSHYLSPASDTLTRLTIASDHLLWLEQGRPELSKEALMESEVPEDEAQS
jgi:hypothetical protein